MMVPVLVLVLISEAEMQGHGPRNPKSYPRASSVCFNLAYIRQSTMAPVIPATFNLGSSSPSPVRVPSTDVIFIDIQSCQEGVERVCSEFLPILWHSTPFETPLTHRLTQGHVTYAILHSMRNLKRPSSYALRLPSFPAQFVETPTKTGTYTQPAR